VSTLEGRFDFLGPGSHQNPYPFYAALREHEPVSWIERERLWIVTRHQDVVDVLRRIDDFSAVANERQEPQSERRGTPNIITMDRPDHDRLRQILQRRFTNRGLSRYQARIDEIVAELMTGVRASGRFDLVRDVSVPLPVTMIAEALGIELERLDDFKRWSDALVKVITLSHESEEAAAARVDLRELIDYFSATADRRRECASDDLVGMLVEAEQEPYRISPREIVSYCLLLLAAGNETTTNLIGGMIIELLEQPSQLNRLVASPEIIPQAIEEGLRYCSPVQVLFRRAKHDTEIRGVSIKAGQDIAVSYAAANRDPRVFEDPDTFDIDRDTSQHVAFGYGLHHCLGAHLARREATAALTRLIPLLPDMRKEYEAIEWVDSWVVRGPKSLPMAWAA